jgi:hypothetical protein
MKKIIILASCIVLFGAGCGSPKAAPQVQFTPNVNEQPVPTVFHDAAVPATEPEAQAVQKANPPEAVYAPDAVIPSDWKTFKSSKYGFQFRYPSDWKIVTPTPTTTSDLEGDTIVAFRSSKTEAAMNVPRVIFPGYSYDLIVTYWKDAKSPYVAGSGDGGFDNLVEAINANADNHQVADFVIHNQKAYKVVQGGMGANDAVMLEHRGIYQFAFETFYQNRNYVTGKVDQTVDTVASTLTWTK